MNSRLLTNCPKCGEEKITDLSHGRGEDRRYTCLNHRCKAQYWKGVWFSWKEWNVWLDTPEDRNTEVIIDTQEQATQLRDRLRKQLAEARK